MTKEIDIDRIDRKILRQLAQDGRIAWSELADLVGLSLTPTLRRVRRLEEAGYIQGYVAKLDEARLAGRMSVLVAVTLTSQSEETLARFEEAIVAAPEVMSCFLMTGDADYSLRVVVPDLETYHQFLTRTLTRIPGVAHIKSGFALRTVLNRASALV
ncbi:MAG: Lrp/AsnC family transcriptional regulator [Lysobacteraceae bacterium]|jgi:Lrp/AsnC family leucine-responsive transcriptional regulator|nr:MAG: Lrp/AsnC family transcriptional regulator [Xanthomonadaceae bacterium]